MFRDILVLLDGTVAAERVVPWVRRLLGRGGGRVRLLTVRPCVRGASAGARVAAYPAHAESPDLESAHLESLAARLRAEGVSVTTEARTGDAVTAALEVAARTGADLIALTTWGYGRPRRFLRPHVTDEIVRRSPVPVLVARHVGQKVA